MATTRLNHYPKCSQFIAALWAVLLHVGVCVPSASAATAQYTLDLSVDNQWKVFADVSDNDNFGIALYSFRFAGQTSTHDNISPRSTAPSSGNGEPAAFTLSRTADNTDAATENNQVITGSQDTTIVPNPHLIYGFGQVASNFLINGIIPGGVTEQATWGEPLLIAQGTYNRLLNPGLTINMNSPDTFVDVFTQADNPNDQVNPPTATIANDGESLIRIPFNGVPEPSAFVLFATAMTGCSSFFRRIR